MFSLHFNINRNTTDSKRLLTHVHFCEAEGVEVGICSPHGWFYSFSNELLSKLPNKRPHVLYYFI